MKSNTSKREILISTTPYDKRIAIMEDGELSELVVEGLESKRVLGNIYKGVVQKVLPGLKAAFVDIGLNKAGFLHQDDAIDRNISLRQEFGDDDDDHPLPEELVSIDEVLKEGQEIMVQVVKEPIGTKGARLTTHLSFAGRFLVCMPGTNFIGVSKKERDPSRRRYLKRTIRKMKSPEVGYIVRTNGLNEEDSELGKQMEYLEAKWELTKQNFAEMAPETLIYEESDSVQATVREYFSDNTDYVYVDSREEYFAMRSYLKMLSPDKLGRIKLWSSRDSLFEYFKIEDVYESTLQRKVNLSRGGYLIIEQTEALMSIDVNTGPRVYGKDQAKIILETNLDACAEIAKQLRLRDIGGLVIIDFIDMVTQEDKDAILQAFKKHVRSDKAPVSFLPLSQFGLMEVTRKRVRVNLMSEKSSTCETCHGKGFVFSLETYLSTIDRWLGRAAKMGQHKKISMVLSSEMADILSDNWGALFHYLQEKYRLELELIENEKAGPGEICMFDTKSGTEITHLYSIGE